MTQSQMSLDSDSASASPPPLHIALVGFMGAGKSSVGRLVAKLLDLPFVDLDERVSTAAGKPVAEVFRERGEVAFRAQERAALRQVLGRPQAVVLATGGGTFLDPATRQTLQQSARCVYLQADIQALWSRLERTGGIAARPLLAGPDPLATATRLLEQRAPLYAECAFQVDASSGDAEAVAHAVLGTLGLHPLHLASAAERARLQQESSLPPLPPWRIEAAAGAYTLEMRAQAGPWLAAAIHAACPKGRLGLISDDRVAPLHAAPLLRDLRALGREVELHTFAAGEASKTLGTAATLYDAMLAQGLTRSAALVALGGGVVGDLCGFVASTYMRGISYIQVPTTTLAAVDSSVGGKTAVNTPRGKNLVGTFYPPRAVLVAGAHLATQGPRAHAAGLVEAVKMAATHDAGLFHAIYAQAASLLAMRPESILPVVDRAVRIKAGVVSRDEREHGERAVLNVGHTVGHALEVGSGFRLLHGEAVALGMVAEAEFAAAQGLGATEVPEALRNALLALNMPTQWRRAKIDVNSMELDKKRLESTMVLPVIKSIGTFALCEVPLATLVEFVAQRN